MTDEIPELFRRLSLGVYIIGVASGDRRRAFTAAWVMQVSFEPLLLALSINPSNACYPLLRDGGGFTVNVLQRDQLEVARRFGTGTGRSDDRLAEVHWRPGRNGSPILTEALAYFDCELAGTLPAGDHQLALGRVVDGRVMAPGAVPLLYTDTGTMDGSAELYPTRL
jgi:flavin reductase (DIM6/NTAB) family NADH-FMN oxidoreductase RutF